MARKPRIDYKGALYHVMCRGNNREEILKEEENKQMYLDLIKKYKKRYGFKLYAYCIMDNHVHMLIEREDVALSKIMQGIQQSYTQRYNKKYERTGHVFQQRYKAQLCNKNEYLLQLIKYIHMNPVKAGLEEGLNYKWSSHRIYIRGEDEDLIDLEFVTGLFSKNPEKWIKIYNEFMNINNRNIENIEKYLLDEKEYLNKKDEEILEKIRLDIDELIEIVCKVGEVKKENIIKRAKIKKYSDVRKAIVLLSEKYVEISNTELAKKLNIAPSMVSKIKSGISKKNEEVERLIELVTNKEIIQA